jgi:tetratricopeptide (TPR) repeat protein
LAAQDKENGKYGQEFEATAYKALGDTVNWLNTLKSGIEKFPDHPFFFGHLVDYYSNSGKYDEALEFANGMIQKNGESSFYLYVLGYLYQNKKDYDQAIEAYKKAVQLDPTNAEAYSNLGLSYCQQGLEYGEKATSDLNDPNYQAEQDKIKKFYEEARPYYEKARELKPDSRNLWLNGLYTIYYKLNLGAEFQEIEALMNN